MAAAALAGLFLTFVSVAAALYGPLVPRKQLVSSTHPPSTTIVQNFNVENLNLFSPALPPERRPTSDRRSRSAPRPEESGHQHAAYHAVSGKETPPPSSSFRQKRYDLTMTDGQLPSICPDQPYTLRRHAFARRRPGCQRCTS